jgi:hypothetical protein
MLIGVNIGNVDDAIEFIKKHNYETYKEIEEAIVKQIRRDNQTLIDIHEMKRYDTLKDLYERRNNHSREKYVEYVEKCDGKPMSYKDFVKKECKEDYIDFSFGTSYEEYIEKVQQKYGNSTYEYYKDIIENIKNESDTSDWFDYMFDGYIDFGNRKFSYINEIIDNIVEKFDLSCHEYRESRDELGEYIIGTDTDSKKVSLQYLKDFENVNEDSFDEIFGDNGYEISVCFTPEEAL